MAAGNFQGLRVLALESRRATEIAKLIRTYGGEPIVAPAMREVPIESNHEALEFAGRLIHGDFDLVIFLTGVGVRRLTEVASTQYERDSFLDALRRVKVACRGPKSSSALRELGIPIAVTAPEPCTWREMIGALDDAFGPSLEGLRAAVQEYGASNPELLSALADHHIECTRVPVYQWALPEDIEPLKDAIRSIAGGRVDVVVFLTSIQIAHLFQVAEEMGATEALHDGLRSTLVLSIGPSTSEELERHGVLPDFTPTHPKMGFLMNEASSSAQKLLKDKRAAAPNRDISKFSTNQSTALDPAVLPPVRSNGTGVSQGAHQSSAIELMHAIGRRVASSDPLHLVLDQIIRFIETVLRCDSAFVYIVEGNELVLRASKNPHPDIVDHLHMRVGKGITGWVAEHGEPVCIDSGALRDPRFKIVKDLPEDLFEAFLSVPLLARGRLVGVINVQHRQTHHYTPWEVQTISMLGFLVGAEIEMARLESENDLLADQLEARKLVERAKSLLQRDFGVNEAEAYHMLQKESRQRRKNMREIAEAVLLSEELRKSANPKQPA